MSKRILFCCFFILIFLIPSKQDPNAKTWERHGTKVKADSIIAAIEREEDVILYSCEICDTLIIAAWERPKGIWYTLKDVRSLIRIVNSTFDAPVSFSHCLFRKDVFLDRNTFIEEARFDRSEFRGLASFMYTKFKGYASFFRVFLKGDAIFAHTTFDSTLSFSLEEFGNLYWLTWKQLDGHIMYDAYITTAMYRLMGYFQERRQLGDADDVYLYLKEQERLRKPWFVRYPEYWFIQLTCGYGVKPWRPLATSLIIIGLFFIAYCVIDIKEKDLSPRILGLNGVFWSLYNGLYYSINTFIAGAPVNWCPKDESKTRFYLFRILTTIERTLGWILLVLFVVTLTRKFIR